MVSTPSNCAVTVSLDKAFSATFGLPRSSANECWPINLPPRTTRLERVLEQRRFARALDSRQRRTALARRQTSAGFRAPSALLDPRPNLVGEAARTFGGMDESAHLHMPFAKCGFGKLALRGMDAVVIFVDPRCVHTDDVC
jgi:hypothetical protein